MDPDIIAEADAIFQKTKIGLFFEQGSGFLGALLCKMSFKWAYTVYNEPLDTAATNGLTLWWNPEFFLSLDKESRVTVLAHEIWHVAYMHMARIGSRDPDVHNIAADHVINLMLKKHGYYMGGFPYIMDKKYDEWSTEDVYDDLMKNPPPPPPIGGAGGKTPDGLGKDIIPAMTDTEVADVLGAVVSAMTTAKMSGAAGDIPGEIEFIVDRFLNPKLPWETLLYNFFNEMTDMEYSFRRPNRRYQDPIMPGMAGVSGLEHLIYYLDISGSISDDDILRFNSEIKFIKDEFNPRTLTLVTFDTTIHDIYTFEMDDPFEKIIVTGRGGTDLHDVFDHANMNMPSAMIIFTDLFVGIPAEAPNCPLIWVCTNNPSAAVPYGKLIHLNKDRVTEGITNPALFHYGPDTGIHNGG